MASSSGLSIQPYQALDEGEKHTSETACLRNEVQKAALDGFYDALTHWSCVILEVDQLDSARGSDLVDGY